MRLIPHGTVNSTLVTEGQFQVQHTRHVPNVVIAQHQQLFLKGS